MSLRRLTWWLVLAFTLVVTLAIYLAVRHVASLSVDETVVQVPFGPFTLELPSGFVPSEPREEEGWEIQDYRCSGIGSLRLAIASADTHEFQTLSCRYFQLDRFPAAPAVSWMKGHPVFARPLLLMEGGIYVIQKHGRHTDHVCMFAYNGRLYWMAFSTRKSLEPYAAVFHRILLSLKSQGDPIPGDPVVSAMASVCSDSWFLFCQPLYFFFALPLAIFLLVMWIMSAVMKRMGRLPDMESLAGLQPMVMREHVEVTLSRRGKKSLMEFGLVVGSGKLTLFMFGKPYLAVNRMEHPEISITAGTGVFGKPVLDIRGPARTMLLRRTAFASGTWHIRVYARDAVELLSYLS